MRNMLIFKAKILYLAIFGFNFLSAQVARGSGEANWFVSFLLCDTAKSSVCVCAKAL